MTPSRWVRYGSAGTEHVTAIAHVIVRHEQLTGKSLEVKKAGDALGNIVEHAKLIGEVLEVLAHTEEVRGQSVVEQEVLDLPLDIAATRVGVVLQPAAVAHLGIEHLAGGEGLTKVCFPHTATAWRLMLQTLSN